MNSALGNLVTPGSVAPGGGHQRCARFCSMVPTYRSRAIVGSKRITVL